MEDEVLHLPRLGAGRGSTSHSARARRGEHNHPVEAECCGARHQLWSALWVWWGLHRPRLG
jgi:hypothetical protein